MSYRRAGGPINNTLETFGDRWSLIILRDSMLGGRPRSFRSYLTETGAQVLEEGGPQLWEEFMDELRHIHVGEPQPAVSAFAKMEAAYVAAAAE